MHSIQCTLHIFSLNYITRSVNYNILKILKLPSFVVLKSLTEIPFNIYLLLFLFFHACSAFFFFLQNFLQKSTCAYLILYLFLYRHMIIAQCLIPLKWNNALKHTKSLNDAHWIPCNVIRNTFIKQNQDVQKQKCRVL